MGSTRQRIKQKIPQPLWSTASAARYAIQRAALWPAAALHPLRRASIRQLERYQNCHSEKRAFIIGNGPSLQRTDLSLLQDEITFGMNRFYLAFPELGFTSTYYVSVNSLVIEQCANDIRTLEIPKFLSWRSHPLIKPGDDMMFLHTTYSGPKFATDVRGRLWEGATVTYVALQLAYYMGFAEVILIGVDHNFTAQGKPNLTVISKGDDPDHFDAKYFGKGFRWQLPDLETSERAYRMAHKAYQRVGKTVLDATASGKLDIFPKVEFNTLF